MKEDGIWNYEIKRRGVKIEWRVGDRDAMPMIMRLVGGRIDVHRSCWAGREWLLSNECSLYGWWVGKWFWVPLIVRYVQERGMTSQRPASMSCSYEEVCIINEAVEQHKRWMNPPQELSEFVECPAGLDGTRLHDISGCDKMWHQMRCKMMMGVAWTGGPLSSGPMGHWGCGLAPQPKSQQRGVTVAGMWWGWLRRWRLHAGQGLFCWRWWCALWVHNRVPLYSGVYWMVVKNANFSKFWQSAPKLSF